MSETATAAEQPIETTPIDDIANIMQQIVGHGTLAFDEVPKVKYLTRPAPTPDGKIAVMLRSFRNGYFLVDKNPDCKGCGGDGLDKRKDAPTKISEIPYCPACVIIEIQHFGKVWEGKLAEKEEAQAQEERAERSDKKLEKRLADARAKVAELEKGKADALGQNVLDVQTTKEEIEGYVEAAAKLHEQGAEVERLHKDMIASFDRSVVIARGVCEQKIRAANEELEASLQAIKKQRDADTAENAKAQSEIKEELTTLERARRVAEESLVRYEAGPAKIAKRWDEKIEPAKKTLERLERQWKSS